MCSSWGRLQRCLTKEERSILKMGGTFWGSPDMRSLKKAISPACPSLFFLNKSACHCHHQTPAFQHGVNTSDPLGSFCFWRPDWDCWEVSSFVNWATVGFSASLACRWPLLDQSNKSMFMVCECVCVLSWSWFSREPWLIQQGWFAFINYLNLHLNTKT